MELTSGTTYIDSGGQKISPEDIVVELKVGLQRFLDGRSAHPHATEARRHQLAGGQHPQVAVLACSDSRVPVEVIFDAGFGRVKLSLQELETVCIDPSKYFSTPARTS